jgi:transposase-like protein
MSNGSAVEKWRRRLAEQDHRSGQSIKTFREQHGLANASFHYWKRRLRAEASPAPERFLPVGVVASPSTLALGGTGRLDAAGAV